MKRIFKFLLIIITILMITSCDSLYTGSSNPVVDDPVVDNPVVDDPVADDPVVDDPVVDDPVVNYTYTDFTNTEKSLFISYFNEVVPFIANNEYYVEEYSYATNNEKGINFYTYDNTESEFTAYLNELESDGYVFIETSIDSYGDTWYYYEKSEYYLDIAYYLYDGEYIVDLYVYNILSTDDDNTQTPSYTYTDFTDDEKALFISYFGEVVPFIANNEYYVEEYSYATNNEKGINFYTYGNTEAEFTTYLNEIEIVGYVLTETSVDSYGDTWYYYEKSEHYLDVTYYFYDGEYIVDLYVYTLDVEEGNDDPIVEDKENVITNSGKGLPTSIDGVYDIDFTEATYVKNVTEQGYYLDGCPTTGSPAVLVIPVEFSDVTAESKGYSIDKIETIFNDKLGQTDYYSVYEYYNITSFGKLDLEITVLDSWFKPEFNSSYYKNYTYDYYGEQTNIGEQLIIDEALAYLENIMNLSKFDSDSNGIIDSIVLINTLDIDSDSTFNWAFRYWNIYTDSNGYYYEYDNVSANDYMWASYQFIHESFDYLGNVTYEDTSVLNPYTYIHEMGHIFGADDYYDTEYVNEPLYGYDVMDSMAGDHNPYTKFNLGWITSSRLVVASDTITLTLEDFSKNGDTIIIANNFDPTLGAYQEYYVLMYYKNSGLNSGDGGYFEEEGVVVYHVNASLYKEVIEDTTYYDVYNNNTDLSSEYGTVDNLIELVTTSNNNFVYGVGDSLSNTLADDLGNNISYTFVVDAVTDTEVTLTFTKNN